MDGTLGASFMSGAKCKGHVGGTLGTSFMSGRYVRGKSKIQKRKKKKENKVIWLQS